jgi:hypothetical protein
MRLAAISAAAFAAWCFAVLPADAGQRGRGTVSANPHAASHTAPPKTTTHGNPHASTRTTTTTVNPIAQKLQGKPLGNRIQNMLPAGMTLDQASSGFRNQGQFIAAVHVSQNLGIPFADLKATMLGRSASGASTSSPMSLGQAIQKLRPTADAATAVRRAERDADHDVHATTKTTTTHK